MPIGSYGGTPAFRTGSQSNTTQELITNDLNVSRGSTYDVTPFDSAVFYENYGYAQALTAGYDTNNRFLNQFFPDSMYQWLPRWESILGIIVPPSATITQRQQVISLYFEKWTKPPTVANITYFIQELLGKIFVAFSFYNSMNTGVSFVPGGVSIPGGATVLNGDWKSYVNSVNVIIWQPTDKYGNLLMDNATFTAINNNFYTFLATYLPAYVTFSTIQYKSQGTGSVSGFLKGTTLYGSGSNFTSTISNTIFIIDDNGNPQVLSVASIQSDTQLTLSNPLLTSITGSIYYAYPGLGFILDIPNNLDRLKFGH